MPKAVQARKVHVCPAGPASHARALCGGTLRPRYTGARLERADAVELADPRTFIPGPRRNLEPSAALGPSAAGVRGVSIGDVEAALGWTCGLEADLAIPCRSCLEHVQRVRAKATHPIEHTAIRDGLAMCGRPLRRGVELDVVGFAPGVLLPVKPCTQCEVNAIKADARARAIAVRQARADEKRLAKITNRANQLGAQVHNDDVFAWLDDVEVPEGWIGR